MNDSLLRIASTVTVIDLINKANAHEWMCEPCAFILIVFNYGHFEQYLH